MPITLRKRHNLMPPPDLAAVGRAALSLRRSVAEPPILVVPASAGRMAELEAQLKAAQGQLAELAQHKARQAREERVSAITIREVDNTAAYLAKTGRRSAPQARVTITTRHVDVA